MNTNNIKSQNFYDMKYDLKGHKRSQKVILKFQNHLFLLNIFCLTPNLFKTLQEGQHYEDTIFLYNEV